MDFFLKITNLHPTITYINTYKISLSMGLCSLQGMYVYRDVIPEYYSAEYSFLHSSEFHLLMENTIDKSN